MQQLIVWDEPILKPIGGHLGKATRSSVFVARHIAIKDSKLGL